MASELQVSASPLWHCKQAVRSLKSNSSLRPKPHPIDFDVLNKVFDYVHQSEYNTWAWYIHKSRKSRLGLGES